MISALRSDPSPQCDVRGQWWFVVVLAAACYVAPCQGEEDRDPAWSDVIDGVAYRIRTDRTVWQAWERPELSLEIRNHSSEIVSVASIKQRAFDPANGLALMQDVPAVERQRAIEPLVQVEADLDAIRDLAPGQTQSVPLTVVGYWQSPRPGVDLPSMLPDQIRLGLARRRPRSQPAFVSNLVTLQVLPPGTTTAAERDQQLKRYRVGAQAVDAGFIPCQRTFVQGEPLEVVFMVRNSSDDMFSFIFGGDYRGSNRHHRFKIEAVDVDAGTPLPEPDPGWEMGGISGPREIDPKRYASDVIELEKYRVFVPGKYRVTARFDLTTDFREEVKVAVESTFEIEVLPRNEAHVLAALQKWYDRCRSASGKQRADIIERICVVGGAAAVKGLADLSQPDQRLELRRAAIAGLGKLAADEALEVLLSAERDPSVRDVALRALGGLDDPRSLKRVIAALAAAEPEAVRQAAIESLGRMRNERAAQALIDTFETGESPQEAARLLAAMGASKSALAFEVVAEALDHPDPAVRQAALSAIVQYDAATVESVLNRYAKDDDLDFREAVVRVIAQTLRKPIDPLWLVPVIQSRKGSNTIGHAPTLLRLHCGDEAVPALLSCLDFRDPSIRNYYSVTLVRAQLACRNGLALPWTSDLNRDGTDQETERNAAILASLRDWLDEYAEKPWSEPPNPWQLVGEEREATWGTPVDGIKLRARVNNSVWPRGFPQVFIVELMRDGGRW